MKRLYSNIFCKYSNPKNLEIHKLHSMEVLISKVLINSNNSHDEFFLINNVLKEYDDTKEEIKNLKT